MRSLADRIKAVRKRLGMSQQELADVLGCSDGKIKGWEQGNTIKIKSRDSLFLTNKYGFNQEWLEDGKGEMMSIQGDFSHPFNEMFTIPYYKDIDNYSNDKEQKKSLDISIVKDMLSFVYSNNLEAIRLTGNSMSPTIEDEDIIFIDKDDVKPCNGKIYLVLLCDEFYIKRVFIEPKSKEITLKSDNPVFPQLKADCEDFKIIGRVVADMKISKM